LGGASISITGQRLQCNMDRLDHEHALFFKVGSNRQRMPRSIDLLPSGASARRSSVALPFSIGCWNTAETNPCMCWCPNPSSWAIRTLCSSPVCRRHSNTIKRGSPGCLSAQVCSGSVRGFFRIM
jgi:hypothetical protein